jgi:cytochrome c
MTACAENDSSSRSTAGDTARPALEEEMPGEASTNGAEPEKDIVEGQPLSADSDNGSPISTEPPVAQTPAAGSVSREAGLELAKASGCLACHAIERKVVGPAWQDVAQRYRDDSMAREQLIQKVAKGGKGNWTEVTGGFLMPPYSPRVSQENIQKLVDFILSL